MRGERPLSNSFFRYKRLLFSLFSTLIVLFLAGAMLLWPRDTYEGARYGLQLWAAVIVPSLLPFFILSEIMLNLGIVRMLGTLCEPLMRPVFNLPGTASFAVIMGFTSGFPMGAVITKRLCEEQLCTKDEGERLVAFTNNSSPLFVLVAVAVGMFDNPFLGIILILAHYLSNLFYGFILGFFTPRYSFFNHQKKGIIAQSIHQLIAAQNQRKPWGKLLADAIRSGSQTIILIGGFMVIFSVLIYLIKASGFFSFFVCVFSFLLQICRLTPDFSQAFATGLWEVTLGIKELSSLSLSLPEKAIAASILLGWSGLSIQAQVISVLSGSGIRTHLYLWGRFFQAIISGFIAWALSLSHSYWAPLLAVPTFTPFLNPPFEQMISWYALYFIQLFFFVCKVTFLFIVILFFLIRVKKMFIKKTW